MSVICDASRLIREGLGPSSLDEEGAANLKWSERLTQAIFRADQVVWPIWMLGIKGEGDA